MAHDEQAPFLDPADRGLFGAVRAAVTVADEDGRISFMNDLAVEQYRDRGGEDLLGSNLLECHGPESQAEIRELYARYRAGDLTPSRYHKEIGGDLAETIVFIPLVTDGRFRGIAELVWEERSELVFET